MLTRSSEHKNSVNGYSQYSARQRRYEGSESFDEPNGNQLCTLRDYLTYTMFQKQTSIPSAFCQPKEKDTSLTIMYYVH